MRHDHVVEGEAFRLRPLTVADAAFIVGLRTDPALGRFLNATSSSVADQVAWTERYFGRAGDFYFIVERIGAGQAEGAAALYDERPGETAEWGRWVLRPGSLAAAESALLLYRFAFDRRGLQSVFCRTLANNAAVVAFHDTAGLARAPAPTPGVVQHELTRARWPAVAATLEQGAKRAAMLARRRP